MEHNFTIWNLLVFHPNCNANNNSDGNREIVVVVIVEKVM